MISINAYKIDGAAQIMYEENQPNEAYASQGTAHGCFISILVILAHAQRDLQKHYRGKTPN